MLEPLAQVSHLLTDPHGSVPLLDLKKFEQFVTLLEQLDEFSLNGLVVSEPPEPGIDLDKAILRLV
jgi:hypothetical protein